MTTSWLLVMWAGGGNVGPFITLAEHLRGRGDRVVAVATASLADRLDDAGVPLVASPDAWLPDAGDVVAAVREHSPDALLVDYMLTGALCGAERCGIPTVALVHTLYCELLDGSVAEGPPAPHPMGMAGSVEAINATRAKLGLSPVAGHGELLDATDLVLVAAPRELDAPGEVPANVAYAGPLLEGPGPDRDWQPPPGDEPLIVVSTGTAGDATTETELLGRILEALAALPVRGLVTLPSYVDQTALRPPPNVVVSGFVRHAAVLPHADVLVTHAGLGTVLAGLAHGVPLVCLPLDREQPDNARAVDRAKAGVTLPSDAPPEVIRSAIADQLGRRWSGGTVRFEPDLDHAVALLDAVVEDKRLAVVDIDGVVADVRHRLHHVEKQPKDWDAFFDAASLDPVHDEGVLLVGRLARDYEIVFLTGRPERLRADTVEWLQRHGLGGFRLVMRPPGDRRPARVVKLGLLRDLARDREVAVVIDDDPLVVQTMTKAGYPTLHATWEARSDDDDQALLAAQEVEGET